MIRTLGALSHERSADRAATGRRRNLIAISIACFLASVGMMVVMPSLPGLLREVSGGDTDAAGLWLGLAISIAPLMTALTGPLWASIGERYGRKGMMERSLIAIGVGVALMSVTGAPFHIVALRAVIGALGGVSVAALAAITASTPRRDLGPAVGTLQAAQTAGNMFGPLLGGALGALVGMRVSFVLAGLVFALALGLVHWLYREAPPLVEAPVRAGRDGARATGALGVGIGVVLLAAFGVQFVEGSFMILLPLQLGHFGVSDDALPMIYGVALSVTYLAATVSAAVAGRLTQRRSATWLMRGVLILSAGATIPMLFATSWWMFVGARVVLAAVAGAAPTLAYAAGASASSPERRSQVVSLTSSAGILGWAASPLTAGAIIQVSPVLLLGLDVAIYLGMAAILFAADRGLLDPLATLIQERGLMTLPSFRTLRPSFAGMRPSFGGIRPSFGGTRDLLDRLPTPATLFAPMRHAERYTTEEVVLALSGSVEGERATAVLELAGQTSRWLPDNPRRAFAEVPQYADRVPTILYQIRQGGDPEVIGRRLSPLGGGWPVRRSVEIAAGLIAGELNR
jgi:DHA1 family multidrug resistance protein-like MFS transporter